MNTFLNNINQQLIKLITNKITTIINLFIKYE